MNHAVIGLGLAAIVAVSGPVLAQQGPGNGGMNYSYSMANGPDGATVHMRQNMSADGNLVATMCLQQPGAPVQHCSVSVNGQPATTFVEPSGSQPGMGLPAAPWWMSFWRYGPGQTWGPVPPFAWTSPFSGPSQGFDVSGRGRWGPYTAHGNFSYWHVPLPR